MLKKVKMELSLKIKMNEKLFLRNPEETELGRKIIQHSIVLIHKIGFEAFTFKKLAEEINTTEAGVYRYFENKHKLLIYLSSWYWSWMEYKLVFNTNNILNIEEKLKKAKSTVLYIILGFIVLVASHAIFRFFILKG